MPTISFANLKGGVGKSTGAVHFATYLAEDGSVLLIDSDKQGSAASWAVWRADAGKPVPRVVRLYDKELLVQGRPMAAEHAWTVIDTRGSDSASTRAALVMSDLALVPVRDSEFDSAAIDDLLAVLSEASALNPGLKVMAYLSQVDKRAKFPKEHIEFLQQRGIQCCETFVSFRRAYNRSTDGKLVDELGDETAQTEMRALLNEVKAALQA